MESSKNKVCTRCVLDTTVPDIRFDDNGVCNYCYIHNSLEKEFPLNEKSKKKFDRILCKIKKLEKINLTIL